MQKEYKNFKLQTDSSNILWLTVDRADASVNSLSRDVFVELDAILDEINQQKPAGVIIVSGKKKGFIAGADISQFTHLKTKEEAFELIRQSQVVLDKLEALPIPTVALIQGFCLGGGLELALACRYRIAADTQDTKIGLPEIKLGIHPGWGGTVRLPRLIGAMESMKMILPGSAYDARKCAKLGIVDLALPERMLKRAATDYILRKPETRKLSLLNQLCAAPFVRPLLGKFLYKSLTDKKVNPAHYPAPYAVVRNWIKDGAQGDAMVNEAHSIAELMVTDTARNLVRVFFLQEKMKGIAKQGKFKPETVHVIGAGTMGGDIAAWCALRGLHVTLQDQSPEKIAPAIKRAYALFQKKLRVPRLVQAAMDRLQPDEKGDGIARADLIIEAVFENLAVKHAIFKTAEEKAKPTAILATNTSSIPLEEIATALQNPSRLVGIHFFNPVDKMPLVEIVCGKQTSDQVILQAASFVGMIGRLPLPVASSPGFLVNRVLMPYLMEAMTLFEEGVPPQAIDKAAVDFGMPMGPIMLADKVGLDVCLSVAENLSHYFGGTVPDRLRDMVKAGHLGVKSGQGFYQYQNGKPVKTANVNASASNLSDISDRMILRMLNESVACLDESVVTDMDLLDGGMIFGTGFAPFLGGPIQYAKSRGVKTVVAILNTFATQYGERFKPNPAWQRFLTNDTVANSDARVHESADTVTDIHAQ